jgi:hypothetical protein
MQHVGKGGSRPVQKRFAVNRAFSQLHLLHYNEFSSSFGQPVAMLVLHYYAGEPYSFPLRFGVHCMDWYHNPLHPPASGQTTKCVWMAAPPDSRSRQVTAIWHTAVPNPNPDRQVRQIEIHSMFAQSTYTLIGLTLEQGEKKPPIEDNPPARRRFPSLAMPGLRTLRCVDESTGQAVVGAKAAIWLKDGDRLLPWGDYIGDADGRLTILLPPWSYYGLEVIAAGTNHAPTKFSLGDNYEKPTNDVSVLKLKRGTVIGGVVRDSNARTVPNALISITSVEGTPDTGFSLFKWPDLITDGDGRWSMTAGSVSSRGLEFRISHPNFLPAEYEQGPPDEREPWILTSEQLQKREAKIELRSGVTLSGRVVAEGGNVVTNARIACFLGQGSHVQRRSTADPSGRVSIQHLEPGDCAIIVSARGHAPALVRRKLEGASTQFDVELKRSVPLRLKVQTAEGDPIPGAWLVLVDWQQLRWVDSMHQSGTDGIINFEGAPLDEAKYFVTAFGMSSELLTLRPSAGQPTIATLRRQERNLR